jgi:CDP-6-deoxy-D-xylo-4-hexulose-3-dehydrase
MNRDDTKALEKQLVAEILERVSKIAELRLSAESEFVPGRTPVPYAGRVYDASEMVNLVESSLEFWLTAGRWHRRMESELAKWYGLAWARLCNSGSSANLLAVTALTSHMWGDRRLKKGDEVITVAAGFPTTVTPLIQNGLVPVFVDVTLPTYNLDASQLEAARSTRTRAVMVAHTLGNPFDLDAVTSFCKKHDLWLVEDNCDASGSLYKGRKTGTFGDVSTLSFYPPHHMTMGEGGAVLCNTDEMKRAIESLRDWGRDCWCKSGVDNTCGKRFQWKLGTLPYGYDHKYVYSHLGYNLKITDMQAAVGVAQLAKLDEFGRKRRENWKFFREAFRDLEEHFILPESTEGADPSWFGFMLTVRPESRLKREAIIRHLEQGKVQTRMLFAGNLLRQPAMVELSKQAKAEGGPSPFRVISELTNTDLIMNQSFWIGVYPGLTAAQREYVVEALHAAVLGGL